jgi:hypothetical protein
LYLKKHSINREFIRDGNEFSMTREELKEAFEAMIPVLANLPSVTKEMLDFDGSARDIESIGYFFYENILPDVFPDNRKAALYILAQALCNDLGFEWSGELILKQKRSGITVDLDSIELKKSEGIELFSSAIEDCFDNVRLTIARRGLRAKE